MNRAQLYGDGSLFGDLPYYGALAVELNRGPWTGEIPLSLRRRDEYVVNDKLRGLHADALPVRALRLLLRRDGMTQKQMCVALQCVRPSLSYALDQLRKLGFLKAEIPDEKPRIVRLSDEGKKVIV